jgi:hypothetical protein
VPGHTRRIDRAHAPAFSYFEVSTLILLNYGKMGAMIKKTNIRGNDMTGTDTAAKVSTSSLLGKLLKTSSIHRFIEINGENMKLPPFHTYITKKCIEMNEVPERITNRAGIESSYGHQIFKGARMPSRDKVIQLAFGFGFGLEDTQSLLKAAQHSPLYPRIERDAAVIFCIGRKRNMIETQQLLHELGLKLLGGERE